MDEGGAAVAFATIDLQLDFGVAGIDAEVRFFTICIFRRALAGKLLGGSCYDLLNMTGSPMSASPENLTHAVSASNPQLVSKCTAATVGLRLAVEVGIGI